MCHRKSLKYSTPDATLLSGDHPMSVYIFSEKTPQKPLSVSLHFFPSHFLFNPFQPAVSLYLSTETMLIKHAHDLHDTKSNGHFLVFIVLNSTVAFDPDDHTFSLKGCPTIVPATPYSPNVSHIILASPPWFLLLGSFFP